MKVLLDSCVYGLAKHDVRAAGHDVEWSGDWPSDPGDDDILAKAAREGRVLVTLDKDFGELAIVHGRPHAGIIRLVGIAATAQGKTICATLERYTAELARGALLVVESSRIRVRISSD